MKNKIKKLIIILMIISVIMAVMSQEKSITASRGISEEPVIVIDAGHGGIDGGATAEDGTLEKDLNLKVAKALEKKAKEYPVKVIMTRNSDEGLYGKEGTIRSKKRADLLKRKEIIDDENVDLVVSIHMNNFALDESVYGAQVFYPPETNKRTNELFSEHTAASYAENVQKALEINISDGRERTAMEKNDILIFEDPKGPIILIECGFLSNKKELERLKTAEYQGVLANAIWDGINANLCLKKKEKIEIINSANKK